MELDKMIFDEFVENRIIEFSSIRLAKKIQDAKYTKFPIEKLKKRIEKVKLQIESKLKKENGKIEKQLCNIVDYTLQTILDVIQEFEEK